MASGGSESLVKIVISKVMKLQNVDPKDIPEDLHVNPSNVQQVRKSDRYFRCKAFASFNTHVDPSGNGHTKSWKSAHAWCTIDLRRQCIAYRWVQECNKCEGESKPWFNEQALERMAEYAVKLYLINIGRIKKRKNVDDSDDNPQIGPPHDEARCDMCKQLGRSCWKKYTKATESDDYDQDEDDPGSYDDDCTDEVDQYYDEYEDEYGYDRYQDSDYDDEVPSGYDNHPEYDCYPYYDD